MVPPLGLEPRTSGSTNLRLSSKTNGLAVNRFRKSPYKSIIQKNRCKLNLSKFALSSYAALRGNRAEIRILSDAPKNQIISERCLLGPASTCGELQRIAEAKHRFTKHSRTKPAQSSLVEGLES